VQSDYAHDVLFVGGAEPDWAAFMREFMRHGSPVLLAGAYWDRYSAFRAYALGINAGNCSRLDGRGQSEPLPCSSRQSPDEHRDIFGPEAETVIYFRDAKEAAQRACALLCDSSERKRLSVCLQRGIAGGAHTYTHRPRTMLRIASGR
jgi:hypothetical protein